MFHIITLYISLDIRTGFFGYLFGFFGFFRIFGLPVRVRLITLRVRICFVPPYKIHSGIFYISDRVRIGFFGSGSVRISDYGFYAQAYIVSYAFIYLRSLQPNAIIYIALTHIRGDYYIKIL